MQNVAHLFLIYFTPTQILRSLDDIFRHKFELFPCQWTGTDNEGDGGVVREHSGRWLMEVENLRHERLNENQFGRIHNIRIPTQQCRWN